MKPKRQARGDVRPSLEEELVADDLLHQHWRDIPPPASIIRAKRDGHLVKIPKPVLVIDSAESRGGYTFARFSKWIAGTEQRRLKNGDYSVAGLERLVTIERKSAADAVSSVMPPLRAHFLERCARMARLQRKAIVIEASYATMRSSYEEFTESRAHPNAVIGSYLAIQERWGIPVHFIDEHELAEEFVAHLLTKFYVRRWLKQAGLGDHYQDGDI
jgi:ERCC4-type nuclease